jgi:hypothetical protein
VKRGVLVVVVLFVVCFSYSVYAIEPASSDDASSPAKNKFSIGVNDLPWDATKISLRWWKNESRGHEFSVGYFKTEIGNNESRTDYGSNGDGQVVDVRVTEIRYDWLRRKKSSLVDNLYLTGGVGLATAFSAHSDEMKTVYDTLEDNRKFKYLDLSFYTRFPIGLEHFFLKQYPNISYSLEADFYAGFGYNYKDLKYEGFHQLENKTSTGRVIFGVEPRFYFRFYLR